MAEASALATAVPPEDGARAAGLGTGRSVLTGLIGSGIQRSLSPALHEAEGRAQGLRVHYQRIDLDRDPAGAAALPNLLAAARTMGFAGLNITYPCKQAVIPLLDGLSDEARAMGAVNTVVFEAGRAIGHNTDGRGWRRGFQRTLPGADVSATVLLGAGGAGSAIAHALLADPAARLHILDADPRRAQDLADTLEAGPARGRVSAGGDVIGSVARATGLIHATPTGMDKLPGLPLPAEALHRGLWVSEIVYFPLETALLRAARAAGCRVSDGGGMVVGQAADAFTLFTGVAADEARMQAHFRQLVRT